MHKIIMFCLVFIVYPNMLCAANEFIYKGMSYVFTSDSTVKLTRGCLEGDVVIPDSAVYKNQKYIVTEIDTNAFGITGLNTKLNSVDIPKTVKKVGYNAFVGHRELKDIYFRGGNIKFEPYAFSKNTETVIRKVHVTSIEEWLTNEFSINNSEYENTLNSNPLNGAYLYINDEEVSEIVIPENSICIPANAFEGMLNTARIICNEGLLQIGEYALFSSNIVEVILPSTLESIGPFAFYRTNIENITLSPALKSIGTKAFKYCKSLQSITIPKNVSEIGVYAFEYTYSLKKIVWQPQVFNLPLGGPATAPFGSIQNEVDTIIIDEEVESLPRYLFYSSVYTIMPVVISRNKKVPSIYKETFEALSSKSKLFVPKGTIEEYRKKWSYFTNIYEIEEETPVTNISVEKIQERNVYIDNGCIYIYYKNKRYNVLGQES